MVKNEYYKTKESVEEYIKLAKDVSGIKLIEKLNQFLQKNSSILEIGSGPGTDWNILNKTYEVTGSDNSKEFLKHLFANNPNGEFVELDAVTLKVDKKFDGIYSNKVLHHLTDHDLAESIKRQYEILNHNGIICHSFWKGEGTEVYNGLFVNYFTENEIKKMFQDYFEILLLKGYQEFEAGDSLLLISRRK